MNGGIGIYALDRRDKILLCAIRGKEDPLDRQPHALRPLQAPRS